MKALAIIIPQLTLPDCMPPGLWNFLDDSAIFVEVNLSLSNLSFKVGWKNKRILISDTKEVEIKFPMQFTLSRFEVWRKEHISHLEMMFKQCLVAILWLPGMFYSQESQLLYVGLFATQCRALLVHIPVLLYRFNLRTYCLSLTWKYLYCSHFNSYWFFFIILDCLSACLACIQTPFLIFESCSCSQ